MLREHQGQENIIKGIWRSLLNGKRGAWSLLTRGRVFKHGEIAKIHLHDESTKSCGVQNIIAATKC